MHNRRARIIRRAGRVVVYLILLAATLICILSVPMDGIYRLQNYGGSLSHTADIYSP